MTVTYGEQTCTFKNSLRSVSVARLAHGYIN